MAIRIIEFSGTHREVGRQHGEQLRDELAANVENRIGRCVAAAKRAGRELTVEQIRGLAAQCVPHVRAFSPGLMEEVEGIAEAGGQRVEDVLLTAGYTDFVDVVRRAAAGEIDAGCTAFWVGPAATSDGATYVGQTWDLFPESVNEVLAMRIRVAGEPELVALSYAGCVGMMGASAAGVGVLGNNLKPTDARPGVPWVFLCRTVLAQTTAEAGYAAMRRARLCSGHNFVLGDAAGVGMCVETTGVHFGRLDPDTPVMSHTNHYRHEKLKPLEQVLDTGSSTWCRGDRIAALLAEGVGRIDRPYLEQCLADREHGPKAICTEGYTLASGGRVATCAAILANLTARQVALIQGPPAARKFLAIQL